MKDAVSADLNGGAQVLDEQGREVAHISGPGSWLSPRKFKKRWLGSRIAVYTPPRVMSDRFTQFGMKSEYKALREFSGKRRAWLDSLDWQPINPANAIDRLADLV